MNLPAIYLPDLFAGAMKSEVGRTSPIMNAQASSYIPRYIPPASMSPQAEPLAQNLARQDLSHQHQTLLRTYSIQQRHNNNNIQIQLKC